MLGRFLPSFSVQQIDKGWDALKTAARNVRDGNNYVTVGVLGDSKKAARRGEALSNVDLALIHEYGTATIPARSFIASTFEAKKPELIQLMIRLVPNVYDGKMTVDQMLGLIGAKLAAEMKNTIREGIDPPLSPVTIKEKGSSLPLVDTGQLINSITWAVKKGE